MVAKTIKLGAYEGAPMKCTVPGCGRLTTRAAGDGVGDTLCRYHIQLKARHGSAWGKTYKAPELRPYLVVSRAWVSSHDGLPAVKMALHWLGALLAEAGRVERAGDIKRKPASERATIAFARLREAGIEPARMLATHMAVSALIEDDRGSIRTEEFRNVQVAKALHRLASGTHRRWEWLHADGRTSLIREDTYPKSSGMVLRVIGERVHEACYGVTEEAVPLVIERRRERFGHHPSQLPGWEPGWRRQTQGGR